MSASASLRAPTTTGSTQTDRDPRERLARFGLVGKGVLHVVVGLSIARLAMGSGSGAEASSTGAVRWIADQPGGTIALLVLAASLAALAVWRGVSTFAGDPVGEDGAEHRLAYGVKTIVYGGLAVLCLTTAFDGGASSGGSGASSTGGSGSSSSGGGDRASEAASSVFDLPAGRWIVLVVGVAIIALAVRLVVVHAFGGRFADRLRVGDDSWAVWLGRVGYGLRSVAYVLVGYFFAHAGLTYDENEAQGLSGSLREIADESWGVGLLWLSAIGFAAYGVYCFAESRLRRDA